VVELDVGAPASPRTLRVGAATAPMDPGATARWAAFDIEHGLPRLPASQVGQWTPQQLSLDRLNAYSIKKGCYPGQEIVARTHFLGQAKRGLVLLDACGALQPGDEVGDATRAIGTAVSVAVGAGGSTALAVLPLERDKATELSAHAIALRERPLLDGLAR
jgi:folate-binding protein YgfZ